MDHDNFHSNPSPMEYSICRNCSAAERGCAYFYECALGEDRRFMKG
jgi:hypothetical protein